MKSAFATIKIPTVLEPNGLFRDDGKRPDGMTVTPFHKGKFLVWDVTCIDRLAPSYESTAKSEGPSVACLAEDRKERKYTRICANSAQEFLPVAVETLGGLGPAFLDFVFKASLFLPKDERPSFRCHLRQRLGVAVQVGNAACIQAALQADSAALDF